MALKKIYDYIFQPAFYAGDLAEQFFASTAREENYPVDKIDQSQQNHKPFQSRSKGLIKRGDFFLHGPLHIEFEVKCLTLYEDKIGKVFLLSYHEWIGHKNKIEAFGLDDVIFALYERKGRYPIKESLRTCSFSFLQHANNFNTLYCGRRKAIRIPIKQTKSGLGALKNIIWKKAQLCPQPPESAVISSK